MKIILNTKKIVPVTFLMLCIFFYCNSTTARSLNRQTLLKTSGLYQEIYNVEDFGAVGDGKTINTKFIQKAIDKCTSAGGGQVIIPNGVFITGTIFLKSNVTIYLSSGSILKGSIDKADYAVDNNCLIVSNNQDNIAVYGRGTIDGSGGDPVFYSPEPANGLPGRPNVFSINDCKNIKIKEITVINGARWNIHLINSDFVSVDDIKVKSRVVANNDGIDLTDCHNVTISNSYFDCGDDAICPKSISSRSVKNLVINNCIIKSESNAIKFGTSGVGGFQDVSISNCTIYDTRLSGIAIEMVDGGMIDRIVISNITMHNVNGGIFIKLGKRKGNKPGILRNVSINNVIADGIGLWRPDTKNAYYKKATNPKIGISIVGQPDYLVENITLSDVSFQFAGGGDKKDGESVMKDAPGGYPEFTNFGVTPAYGLNFRHVNNIVLRNVKLSTISPDARPAIFFDDVKKVDISTLRANVSENAGSFIRFKDIENIYVHGCKPDAVGTPFLSFEGHTSDVSIINNDLHKVSTTYIKDSGVNEKEIYTINNRNK